MKYSTKTSTKKSTQPSSSEVRDFYNSRKEQLSIANYNKAKTALRQVEDLSKSTTKTIQTFDKTNLRNYFKNISSNQKNLRNFSRFLYYRCQPYFKVIQYHAGMFCLDARSVIPAYDPLKKNQNINKFLKGYYQTLKQLEIMNIDYEFYKGLVSVFREDVFYGCAYLDDEGFFILPLDPDYCKIAGLFPDGTFDFAMDMSFFSGTNEDLLEYYGEPFNSMYREYGGRYENRWQIMPEEYAVCMKFRADDWQTCVPVFSGIFNSIINLIGTEDVQAIADQQDIYKMLWIELETLSGSKDINDWKIDPDLMIDYFNRMIDDALPDYVSAAIIPGKINSVSFDKDTASDVNKVAKSTETLFNTSGGAQILNSSTLEGSTAFEAAMKADSEFTISPLLPQIQGIVNRLLKSKNKNAAFVKFMPITVYTKDAYKKSLTEDATYGLPVKLALNTLNHYTEQETLALNYLENECLHLADAFVPLQSSHTTSNKGTDPVAGGRPPKDATELTSDGDASRDKADRAR